MYDQDYVKKRKKKRAAAIFFFVGSVGVTALGIIAFLGRFVGTFTVTITNGEVNLALSEKASFEQQESMLRIDTLAQFEEFSYETLPGSNILDNEDYDYFTGAVFDGDVWKSMEFFKYTFYVKNVGFQVARYDMQFIIRETKKSDDGTNRYLDDTIRFMIYQNDGNKPEDHDYKIYAKEAAEYNYTADGVRTRREFVSEYPENNTEDADHPLCEIFTSPSVIAEYSVNDFGMNDMIRYTVVAWLDGYDPQSSDEHTAPLGASMKIGVEIKAYEN